MGRTRPKADLFKRADFKIESQMDLLKAVSLQWPYCGESIEILIDCTLPRQEHIEDCQVCCKPITISVKVEDDDGPQVEARQEDE